MNGYIKRGGWVAAALLGCLGLAVSAQGASFDCTKAGTKVEHIICDNPEISKLDDEMEAGYKAALQDKAKVGSIKQAQRQWMKERNGCADAGCVKRAYEIRLLSLSGKSSSTGEGINANKDAGRSTQNEQRYRFKLIKGKGVPVCDAYLERLNVTEYKAPPFCDRPENDAVKGFSLLNRVPLSPADVHDLFPIFSTFRGMANNKNLDWADANLQLRLTQSGQFRLTDAGVKSLQMNLDRGWAKMWRYDPPVDIDNDGKPDNVEIWYGSIVGGVGGARCGDDLSGKFGSGLLRQPQIAFVTSGSNDRLDVSKTKEIFQHPSVGYRLRDGFLSTDFRPIGMTTEIFKYQDIYYFDTFFDGWGDFEDKRRKDSNIINTLAVFLHKDGKTRQVCEYQMMDTQNTRGTK